MPAEGAVAPVSEVRRDCSREFQRASVAIEIQDRVSNGQGFR
jgi:hypothetical protein